MRQPKPKPNPKPNPHPHPHPHPHPNPHPNAWQGYYGYCGGGSSPSSARGEGGEVMTYDLVDNSGRFTCVGPFEMWLAAL